VPIKGYPKLKAFFTEHNIRHEDVASLLRMSRTKLSTILNGKRNADFKVSEIKVLASHFNWSNKDVDQYFFNIEVA